ncbi:MAG: hypothetical protein V4519_02600 [Patescibacteria group bacterium]
MNGKQLMSVMIDGSNALDIMKYRIGSTSKILMGLLLELPGTERCSYKYTTGTLYWSVYFEPGARYAAISCHHGANELFLTSTKNNNPTIAREYVELVFTHLPQMLEAVARDIPELLKKLEPFEAAAAWNLT